MSTTAKVFWSGRSQAIRLPKEFRFDTNTVRIRRHGQTVMIEPIPQNWDWLQHACRKLDKDFMDAVNEEPKQQVRDELDDLFK